MLATAGLMLSVAALLVLIGLGESQIAASEAKTADLFGNWWFDVGLFFAAVGLLWGAAAVAAIGSQGRARREFAALEVEVIGGGFNPTTLPDGMTTTDTWYSQLVAFRITNRELTRSVHLVLRLKCALTPGFGDEAELRMPPTWQKEPFPLGGSLAQLRSPLPVGPQSTVTGFVVFDFANVSPYLTDDRTLELMDHNCGRSVLVSTELGTVHDFT